MDAGRDKLHCVICPSRDKNKETDVCNFNDIFFALLDRKPKTNATEIMTMIWEPKPCSFLILTINISEPLLYAGDFRSFVTLRKTLY